MSRCRIQRPISLHSKSESHGDTLIQITHDDVVGEVLQYEGDRGDLRLHLKCQEDVPAFVISNNGLVDVSVLESRFGSLEALVESLISRVNLLEGR